MPADPRDPLSAVEAALTGLAPAAPRLDRDGLMYAAGRAAGARPWRIAVYGLALTSVALVAAVGLRPVRERERVVTVVVPAPAPTGSPAGPGSAPESPGAESVVRSEPAEDVDGASLELRRRLLRWGPDAMPATGGAVFAAPPARPLEQDLGLPPGSLKGADGRRSHPSPLW